MSCGWLPAVFLWYVINLFVFILDLRFSFPCLSLSWFIFYIHSMTRIIAIWDQYKVCHLEALKYSLVGINVDHCACDAGHKPCFLALFPCSCPAAVALLFPFCPRPFLCYLLCLVYVAFLDRASPLCGCFETERMLHVSILNASSICFRIDRGMMHVSSWALKLVSIGDTGLI